MKLNICVNFIHPCSISLLKKVEKTPINPIDRDTNIDHFQPKMM